LDRLAHREAVEIAVDTEYDQKRTLTIQAATWKKKAVRVQVYRSNSVPDLPAEFRLNDYLSLGDQKVQLLPVQSITRQLSPARMLLDLHGLSLLRAFDWAQTQQLLQSGLAASAPVNATWNEKQSRWDIPRIQIRMVAHFLTADLGRMFGVDFYSSLFAPSHQGYGQLYLPDRKLLTIASSPGSFLPPVVDCIVTPDNHAYLIELEFTDTMLPFGGGSLDQLCQTFLGRGKSQAIRQSEKENMLRTFRLRTADAYGYAISDVTNELLLYLQMKRHHREVFRAFNVPKEATPPMRATLGRRTSDFIQALVQQTVATGSQRLASDRELKALIRMGGPRPFGGSRPTSRFGQQTATSHGGLLFSRTSTRFWHEAPGQLRDVDMQGCYNRITSQISVYLGRPVVWEPGDCRMTLRKAVEQVEQLAPSDGWFLRVTGEIQAIPNVLIPSTLNAVTHMNIRQRTRRARLAVPPAAWLQHPDGASLSAREAFRLRFSNAKAVRGDEAATGPISACHRLRPGFDGSPPRSRLKAIRLAPGPCRGTSGGHQGRTERHRQEAQSASAAIVQAAEKYRPSPESGSPRPESRDREGAPAADGRPGCRQAGYGDCRDPRQPKARRLAGEPVELPDTGDEAGVGCCPWWSEVREYSKPPPGNAGRGQCHTRRNRVLSSLPLQLLL
jgi:hypothetical protein